MQKPILSLFCFAALLVVADRSVDALLKAGLERYFGLDQPAEVLCVGHSRTVLGLAHDVLEEQLGVPVAKYGMDGVNTFDRCAMVRYFLQRHPEVRLLVYDVESTGFTTAQLSAHTYRLFLPFMDDRELLRFVRRQCPSMLQFGLRRMLHTTRYDEAAVNRAVRGWLGYDENLKQGRVDLRLLRDRIADGRIRPVATDPDNYRAFVALMDEVSQKGIRVLLWHPPTIDLLDDVDRPARDAVRKQFRQLADANARIAYVEYVSDYRSRHDLFYDGIHMNAKGKAIITDALAQDIKRLGLLPPQDLTADNQR